VPAHEKVSDRLERWLQGDQPKTLASLIELFGGKSFAIVFVVLMALPALPLPTGGVTHVLEVVVMLLALELLVGRRTIWLPARWRRLEVGGTSRERFAVALVKRIRWFERLSRPRLGSLLRHRLSDVAFGAIVLVFSLTAFLAPPFSGLDTLPSLGVVLVSLGVLLEDVAMAGAGVVVGALGVAAVIGLGQFVVRWIHHLF
jgi:hypothetical protein